MSNESEEKCCSSKSSCCGENLGLVYASWLARIWLGVRAVQTGIEKYATTKIATAAVKVDGVANTEGLQAPTETGKIYALYGYHGVPAGLMKKFEAEPLMLKWALPLYDKVLGPALIVLGAMILLGLLYRTSLFLLGLLYVSLTWGLILIKQDDGVSWLGVHMILIVAALALANHNRLALLKKF